MWGGEAVFCPALKTQSAEAASVWSLSATRRRCSWGGEASSMSPVDQLEDKQADGELKVLKSHMHAQKQSYSFMHTCTGT